MKKVWQVWTENDIQTNLGYINGEKILFEGSETEARKYYKKNGGSKAKLHIGYLIPDSKDSKS